MHLLSSILTGIIIVIIHSNSLAFSLKSIKCLVSSSQLFINIKIGNSINLSQQCDLIVSILIYLFNDMT